MALNERQENWCVTAAYYMSVTDAGEKVDSPMDRWLTRGLEARLLREYQLASINKYLLGSVASRMSSSSCGRLVT